MQPHTEGLQYWGHKLHRKPPPHTHTHTHIRAEKGREAVVNEHVCLYLQGCVNVCSTTPSCRLPSVWASALHNSLFLCVSGWPHVCELFIASLHTLGMVANGEALLFITHLGHTKIFFFFWFLALQCFVFFFFLFFPPSSHTVYFITSQE